MHSNVKIKSRIETKVHVDLGVSVKKLCPLAVEREDANVCPKLFRITKITIINHDMRTFKKLC